MEFKDLRSKALKKTNDQYHLSEFFFVTLSVLCYYYFLNNLMYFHYSLGLMLSNLIPCCINNNTFSFKILIFKYHTKTIFNS